MAILYAKNIADAFHKRVEESAAKTAWIKKEHGSWASTSWRDVEEEVFRVAKFLQSQNIRPGDKVALILSTKPQWAVCDFAILSIGAVCVPIYPSLSSDDVYHILNDAHVKLALVEDSVQWFKIKGAREKLAQLDSVIMLSSSPDEGAPFIKDLIDRQEESDESPANELNLWRDIASKVTRESPASIVYTSGTTGLPKGVLLTHGNFLAACEGVLAVIDVSEEDSSLFFLPPAHVLGRVEQFLNVLVGWKTAYCENPNYFTDYLAEVQPTFFVAVPRIFEKIFHAISTRFKTGTPFGRHILDRAFKVAFDYSKCLESGKKPGLLLSKEYDIFDKVLFSKVRAKFGANLRFCVVGGASMPEGISRFFHACGVLILEGYGLTESAGPLSLNTPKNYKIGSVGKPLYGNRIRLNADAELMIKGPSVFNGYYNDDGESDSLFSEDGFFATGDIGGLDHESYLKIIDRKKDILVTSGGKNIAPQKIEKLLVQDTLISQAMVVGGDSNPLSALLSVDLKEARRIFKSEPSSYSRFDDWLNSSAFQKMLWDKVRVVNQSLNSFERIKKIRHLPRDLSVEAGELTPSLKIKRAFCRKKFSKLIEEMYAGEQ